MKHIPKRSYINIAGVRYLAVGLDTNKKERIKAKWNKRASVLKSFLIIAGITALLTLMASLILKKEVIPQTNANYSNAGILDDLNLGDCRITQNQESHIKKGGGSMYAYDIACIRGQEFDIFTPLNRDIYLLEDIGYDERLGNYIVLKHGDLRWIYGHTITELKEGEVLKGGQILGKTNISGVSQNYHLHIELWAYKNNIRFEYLETKKPVINEKSLDLRMQRNIVSASEINGYIVEFIEGFEGIETKAYWDVDHWAIGLGTSSYKGEVISKQEARTRARITVQNIREKYNLDGYKLNVQKAVVSFIYNIGSLTTEQIRLLENGFYKALGNDFKQYVKADGVYLEGLNKRRIKEDNLLCL